MGELNTVSFEDGCEKYQKNGQTGFFVSAEEQPILRACKNFCSFLESLGWMINGEHILTGK